MSYGPNNVGSAYGGHLFSRVPRADIERSRFDRSKTYKTTLDGGWLVPFYCEETLPGDTVSLNYKQVCRMTTPVAPFMDNVHARVFFFHVPKRLVWEHFEDFITGGNTPDNWSQPADYIYPKMTIPKASLTTGSIFDYFGLPVNISGNSLTVNSLPFRAYNLIWNEWFRDENLQAKINVRKTDTDDSVDWYSLRKRGKRHDYFTSCLPAPQKGPAVDLPLGDVAPVLGSGTTLGLTTGGVASGKTRYVNLGLLDNEDEIFCAPSSTNVRPTIPATGSVSPASAIDSYTGQLLGVTTSGANSGLVCDLSSATAASINQFRQAFQLQKYYERLARGGSRYTEWLLSMFGVRSPDARLQRPEYLGGGTIDFMVQAVAQTSASDEITPQGNLAAVGTATDLSGKIGFSKSFVEHGYIIGLVCIYTDLTYQQGLNRMWSRSSRFDEYLPVFAHLGEQPVYNKEIYCQGVDADNGVFGYQERYAEYRYSPSMITGKLRSSDPQSLDVWHLSQYFGTLPTLSASFIEENPPFARVLAVQNEPQFILAANFSQVWTRPLPLYGVPGWADHF